MGEAYDWPVPRLREGIQARGLHLDSDKALRTGVFDGKGSLSKGSVRRPRRPARHGHAQLGKSAVKYRQHAIVDTRVGRRRKIVIARPFISERALDQHEKRRCSCGQNQPRGAHADQKLAARRKQFLGDQHGEGSSYCAADDAKVHCVVLAGVQLGVITSPMRVKQGLVHSHQAPYDISIGIEHADAGDSPGRQPFLPSCFAKKIFGRKHRRLIVALVAQDWRRTAAATCPHRHLTYTRATAGAGRG